MHIPGQKELFVIRHDGRNLSLHRRGRGRHRTYLGYINGEYAALAPGKGECLRIIINMARSRPKAPPVSRPRIAALEGRR
jgi:hypothetical protein